MDDDCYPAISMNTGTCISRNQKLINQSILNNNNIQNSCKMDCVSVISNSSDIDIDDTNIKEEPLSPDSSCPSSPNATNFSTINVNLANMAAFTNTDLVLEHKVIVRTRF